MSPSSCWHFSDIDWDTMGEPRRGIEISLIKEEEGAGVEVGVAVVKVGKGSRRASAILRAGLQAELVWARVDGDILHSAPYAMEEHSAFLLVELAPGAGPKGSIEFRSCLQPTKLEVGGRTARVFPAFPPPGIKVLAESGLSKLLELEPWSKFQIDRRGYLEGAPGFFQLGWTGHQWKVVAHPNRRLSDKVWL